MATTLFLRETTDNLIGSFRDALTTRGSASTSGIVNTAASGTNIQWTKTAGGSVLEWISGRSPAGGWTLSGGVTVRLRALESNMNANAGGRIRLYKRAAAGGETELTGSPWNDGVEFGTADAAMDWSFTPTSMAFAENDRLVIRYFITNIGTMAGGFTCTMTYDGPTTGAAGDTFVTLTETVTFKLEDITGNLGVTLSTISATTDGDVAVQGSTSSTLDTIASSTDGDVAVQGTTNSTLAVATLSASGTVSAAGVTGDLNATLASLASTTDGVVAVQGTANPSLSAVTQTATGAVALQGDASPSLGALAATTDGDVAVAGTMATQLQPVTANAQGTIEIFGSLSSTLATVTDSSDADVAVAGTLNETLAALSDSAMAAALISGSSAPTLGVLVLSFTAGLEISAALMSMLGPMVLVAQGGAPEVPPFTIVSVAFAQTSIIVSVAFAQTSIIVLARRP